MAHAPRVMLIDIARTCAIVAMAIFHFTYDLELFGFAPRGTMTSFGWVWFARCIAGSFIFLSGVSLVLASLSGPVDLRKYARRMAVLGAAALAVSLGTYVAMGAAFVRFGVLHHLFLAGLLGLVFLRLPYWVTAALGVVVLSMPLWSVWPFFDSVGWLWLGKVSTGTPAMVDYVPMLPWFGMYLLGMGIAGGVNAFGGWARLAGLAHADNRLVRALSWPGQHSLAIYLIHQPVLFGIVYTARLLAG
ncbi:heparan-alpha-glucosaminide N-acetyltransferase [Planktotalea sp.]|uniref:heparan-alpha-glucosaminide N-acetyltransferase n=1 Tax=Planktotalea sp. TaxID=2029877 RepID=UPI0032970B33